MNGERGEPFRAAKIPLSLLLGVLMLTFGSLKFLSATVDGWFHAVVVLLLAAIVAVPAWRDVRTTRPVMPPAPDDCLNASKA